MPDEPHLRPATPDEIAMTDDAMARITAARLVRHLERSGSC
jgi:hypothetical protein